MRRSRAPLVLAIVLAALSTSGCIQLGEYAMSAECESFSKEVAEVVQDTYEHEPKIVNMWAGEAAVWCTFDVLTDKDAAADDRSRAQLRTTVQTLLEDTFDSGVEVTLVYVDDQDFILLDTRESLGRAECRTVSEQIESLVVERYDDEAYVVLVQAPAAFPDDPGCRFDIMTRHDSAADDPGRVEIRRAVQDALPADVEANLIYVNSRDRVTDSSITIEMPASD